MDIHHVMGLLVEACAALEASGDHAAAANVGQAMELVSARYGFRMPSGDPPHGRGTE